MTHRERIGLIQWVRVTSTNAVTGRCFADTIALARERLPCGADEAVVSAASYALGVPKACRMPTGMCGNCAKEIDATARYCASCLSAQRRAREKRSLARAAKRAQLRRKMPLTGQHRQAIRDANIRLGVARRRDKRRATSSPVADRATLDAPTRRS